MSDDELRSWQSAWQQERIDLSALHARARRDDRRHRLLAVAEYAATGGLLAGSLLFAAWRNTADVWAWLAAVWLLGVPALVFAWWNRRGLWGRAGLGARQHLQLALRRCERGLRALRVAWGLLAASTVLVLLFAFGIVGGGARAQGAMLAWLALFVAVHVVVMGVMQRRLHARRAAVARLLHELDDGAM